MNKAHDAGLRRTQGHAEQEGHGREHVEIVKYRKEAQVMVCHSVRCLAMIGIKSRTKNVAAAKTPKIQPTSLALNPISVP